MTDREEDILQAGLWFAFKLVVTAAALIGGWWWMIAMGWLG